MILVTPLGINFCLTKQSILPTGLDPTDPLWEVCQLIASALDGLVEKLNALQAAGATVGQSNENTSIRRLAVGRQATLITLSLIVERTWMMSSDYIVSSWMDNG